MMIQPKSLEHTPGCMNVCLAGHRAYGDPTSAGGLTAKAAPAQGGLHITASHCIVRLQLIGWTAGVVRRLQVIGGAGRISEDEMQRGVAQQPLKVHDVAAGS